MEHKAGVLIQFSDQESWDLEDERRWLLDQLMGSSTREKGLDLWGFEDGVTRTR